MSEQINCFGAVSKHFITVEGSLGQQSGLSAEDAQLSLDYKGPGAGELVRVECHITILMCCLDVPPVLHFCCHHCDLGMVL